MVIQRKIDVFGKKNKGRNVKTITALKTLLKKKKEFVPVSAEEKIYSKPSWQFRKRIQDQSWRT